MLAKQSSRIFLLLLTGFFLQLISTNGALAQSCCTLSGWQYSRAITIDNTGGPAYTNYRFLFVFDSQTPISQGKMTSACTDLRFKDGNCGNELPYWIESGLQTTATNVWILVPSVAANSVTTIYMFYGNPGAPAQSLFSNVFTNTYTVTGTQTLSGTQTYDWFEVPAGATLNTTAGQLLTINAAKIKINGTVNGDGMGYGPAAGPGAGGSGGGGQGGGGGGYGAAGGRGGGTNNGGAAYGTAGGTDLDMGSGPGGSDCGATAKGGGAFKAVGTSVEVTGSVHMLGEAGQFCCCNNSSEAAGGAAGGGILLQGRYVTGNGALNVRGGKGGDSDDKEGGGGGAGGRIKIFYGVNNGFTGTTSVQGGANGSGGQSGQQPGGNGTFTSNTFTTYSVTVGPEVVLPTADFTTGAVCDGSPVSFTDLSTISTGTITDWLWDFGDGQTSSTQNPTHTYSTANTYNVTLTITSNSGCVAMVTNPVTVNPNPVADFSFNNSCVNVAVNFTDASTISSGSIQSWQWDFGNSTTSNQQNPSKTYSAANTYTVSLTVTSDQGCTASTTETVTISPNPTASYTISAVCEGEPTVFTDNSTVNPGSITAWLWDFGDSQTSSVQNPTHSYSSSGSYNVSLTVTSSDGCSATSVQGATVNPGPTADFSAPDVCEGLATAFTNLSSVSSGTISTYLWDFDDNGATSDVQSPSHTFSSAGTFDVSLTVTTNNGCSQSVMYTVTVFANPVADFAVQDVCEGATSTFSDLSAGAVTTWDWDFDDGQTANTQNPPHAYATPATYNVTLTVTTADNCQDDITIATTVHPNPTADFAVQDVCESLPNSFTDNSTGNISTWQWDFGDSQTSDQQNPSHSYSTPNTYTVDLTVTTAEGCTDNTSNTVTVFPGATADFSATTVCEGNATAFTDLSVPSTGASITGWTWDFGVSGGTSPAQSPTYTYSGYGDYTVSLTVTTSNNCISQATDTVTVYAVPAVSFTGTDVCLNQTTEFTNSSSISQGQIASYAWSFGDGQTSTSQNPTNTYSADNTYTVQLVATSDNGCMDTASQTVTVYPLPQVSFSNDPVGGCVPIEINFVDESTISSGTIVNWAWAASGSGQSSNQNPSFTYTGAGIYDVSLTVTSDQGCVSSQTSVDLVTIYPLPTAGFLHEPVSPDIIYPEFEFEDISIDADTWEWDFGDFSAGSTEQNPSHLYPDTGTYEVTLIVYSEFGCGDTITEEVTVRPAFLIYIPTAFTPDGDGLNDTFKPEGFGFREFEMRIYSRWGHQLFVTNDPTIGWDGTYPHTNEPVMEGQYVYRIIAQSHFDYKETYDGKVILIR